jgi:uncharacterized membrane protein YfcA
MNIRCRSTSSSTTLLTLSAVTLFLLAAAGLLFSIAHPDDDGVMKYSTSFRKLSLIDEDEDIASLFPFRPLDYIGFFCAVAGLMLAAGGGIGGGGILVPIYILIFDFPVKHAIPLASVTVLGGSMANNMLNARKEHPDHPHRSCIDWNLILQFEPVTMAGTLIGAKLNTILPDIAILVMLLVLLTMTAYTTLSKANALHAKESEALKAEEKEQLVNNDSSLTYGSTTTPPPPAIITDHLEMGTTTTKESFNAQDSNLEATLGRQNTYMAIQLTGLLVVVSIINLLKGGPEDGGGPLGLASCGTGCYWFTSLLLLSIIFAFAYHVRASLLRRVRAGQPTGDIVWNEKNSLTYPAMAIVAGLVAGMFGIGGGIVKGPMFLALGVPPTVASATCACMILFTSSTATVSYIVFQELIYDYGAMCWCVGLVSTLLGQTVMSVLIKRYQRNSYIAYSIGIVVALSAVAMSIESILAIWKESSGDATPEP